MSVSETLNMDYLEEQYEQWKTDPQSVSRDWQYFFKGFELADAGGPPEGDGLERAAGQSGVESLIYRHRDLGHLLACMDPLAACPTSHPLLDLGAFGLSFEDLEREFVTPMGPLKGKGTLKEIVQVLRETYCHSIGVEYMHLQDPGERRWLRERMEPTRNRADLDDARRIRILKKLLESTLFETFLNKKFVGVTRFSLEGGDAVIPLLDVLVQRAAGASCDEIILGMAHRGRLNVQVNILKKPYEEIFEEFESCYDPTQLMGAGDVKYHNGYLADLETGDGSAVRIYLVNNPSHLEAVNPVVQGVARARQDLSGKGENRILPVQLHGDAAFAGQGLVAETLNMSRLDGYRTGGTVHLVINNQIGYTTTPEDARSTRYSTDVAKMLLAPVFHVHGEDPEAAVHAAELALAYRNAFHKDVVIDLICYRRYGHNEGDEPYFTQPMMYNRIRQRPSLDRVYE
ncbi:MAG: 2-oxoglutarate dehydrogenase E1 component, partial [Desulfobacterales bacterium]|nr:2-oxoglutarate dehydrogenase E1 component [Desulfobacterales bacterium]